MNNLIKREDNALTTDIKIIVEPIDLDFLDDSTIIDTDIYDISFSKGINKADLYDYSFAIFCGITSYVLNHALKSKYDIYSLSIGTMNMVIKVIAKITAVIGFSFIISFILVIPSFSTF